MRLSVLAQELDEGRWPIQAERFVPAGAEPDPEISAVTHDSRQVTAGSLFCCVSGAKLDGHRFANDASRAGAVALLVNRPERTTPPIPQLVVADTRAAMGPLAAAFHGHPSESLEVVGVTGTNGKTTTTHMIAAIWRAAGRRCELVGTLSGARTTPEATDLQRLLRSMCDRQVDAVAMEVSSHALDLNRVDGTRFRIGVFTNLSQDHLDHHGTMEAYFRAKARFFESVFVEHAVVNADDPYGQLILDTATVPTTAFSIADAVDLVLEPAASTFRWHGKEITLPMGGRFNVSNALAAATAAAVLGVPDATIASALTGNPPIPGRFEVIDEGQPFSAIVDYAHTPDGLERLLEASRPSGHGGGARGRLIVVFGCGGDRDRSKRPQMGEIASRVADVVVITSDNPRSEDPSEIIEQVRAGAVAAREIIIEPDRRKAIGFALALARGGDVVMVAGKGHERGQERDGVVTPFDDREEVREGLASLGFAATTGHRDLLDLPRKDRRPCV